MWSWGVVAEDSDGDAGPAVAEVEGTLGVGEGALGADLASETTWGGMVGGFEVDDGKQQAKAGVVALGGNGSVEGLVGSLGVVVHPVGIEQLLGGE